MGEIRVVLIFNEDNERQKQAKIHKKQAEIRKKQAKTRQTAMWTRDHI